MKLVEYRKISPALNLAIQAAIKANGLDLPNHGIRATINEATGEINLRLTILDPNHKDASGNSITPEAARWKELAALYDLKPEWLGESFNNGPHEMKILGLKKSGKKCVLLESRGKQYVTTIEDVQARFALKEKLAARTKAA